ncbi:LysM peptidoglycan-binding domain-containing protein [Pseudomonas aeruginosa]|uniref:LysM peptidoglycan-binding domain-containing protein n=1 Tax=Pseudomonas aeruginosa TaxID=287 RepID=UPI00163BF801|nr:hypothetical protein [Pseudomonas aeruginosa]
MTKANECTCPSGDGSLRHPCPAHPAVEQAGGDERVVDGKPRATKCPDCGEGDLMPGDLCACGYETDPAAGYACSECDGSGEGCVGEVCRECDGSGWFVTPEQARAALAQPSPAQAEKAEAERPEVVARVVHSNPVVLGQCGPLNANDEMMTVAQHAASVARWAEMFNRVEQERDAALARVAELDKQCRDDVARALGLRPSQERGFAWSYLLASIKSCVKASEDAAQAQHSVPAYVSYTTRPAESLAGIALRQLKEESRWVEIRDINAPAFPDMQSHSYYPAGTVIKLPA